jgi:hypothetical protein
MARPSGARTVAWRVWVTEAEYAALEALRGHFCVGGRPRSRAGLLRLLAEERLRLAAAEDPACAAALARLRAEPEPGASGRGRPPRVRAGLPQEGG